MGKIVKIFEKDFFSSDDGVLALAAEEVEDSPHKSGWAITGGIHTVADSWVGEFRATHEQYGVLEGEFESVVTCESEEAFEHFWRHHEPISLRRYE